MCSYWLPYYTGYNFTLWHWLEACGPLERSLKWLGLIKGVSQALKEKEGELNHIKALGCVYHSSWLKNMTDVEQWVSWQQGTEKQKCEALINCLYLACVQTKPAEPPLPPKTRGHSELLRDHGQKEKRTERSFYLSQDEVKQPQDGTVTRRRRLFKSKDQGLC